LLISVADALGEQLVGGAGDSGSKENGRFLDSRLVEVAEAISFAF
jgi:hypothetical protein